MIRIEKLSKTLYLVNHKRIMLDKVTFKALDDNDVLTMQESIALKDFVKANEGAIKIRSTVR